MKRSSANLKTLARESLNGNFGLPILANLIIVVLVILFSMLVTAFLDTSSITSMITNQILLYMLSLLIALCNAGYGKMLLNVNRRQPYTISNLFYVFSHNPDRFLVVNLLFLLVQILFGLPLDILSYTTSDIETSMVFSMLTLLIQALVNLIVSTFFGLANYLLLDNPDMGAIAALKESLCLMKGNKGRYLYIQFSFLPLYLASVFTCYIGMLWLIPYMQTTMAYFYMDVAGELDAPKAASKETPDSFINNPF